MKENNDIVVDNEEDIIQKNNESYQVLETSIGSNFFVNNDEMFDAIDNPEILKFIIKEYPSLHQNSSDTIIKKTLLQLLNNEDFMLVVLERYNMNIFDFFKILFKCYSSIFKTSFLKSLKQHVYNKKYVNFKKH